MLDSMIHLVPMAATASLTLVTPGIHDTFEQHFSHDHTIRIMPRFVCSYLFLVMAITAATTAVATNTTTTTSNDDVKQEYVRSLYFVHDQEETLRSTKTKDANKTTWRGLRGSTTNQQPDHPPEVSQDVVQEIPSEVIAIINDIDSVASPRGGSLDDPDAFKRGGIAVNTKGSKRHHHHQRLLADSKTVGTVAGHPSLTPMSPGVISSLLSLGRTDDNSNPSSCHFNTCYGNTCDYLVETWAGITCDDLVYVYECDCSGNLLLSSAVFERAHPRYVSSI